MTGNAIPLDWIKQYVDQLLEVSQKLDPGPMQDAMLRRADHAMDLVQAWKDRNKSSTDPLGVRGDTLPGPHED